MTEIVKTNLEGQNSLNIYLKLKLDVPHTNFIFKKIPRKFSFSPKKSFAA